MQEAFQVERIADFYCHNSHLFRHDASPFSPPSVCTETLRHKVQAMGAKPLSSQLPTLAICGDNKAICLQATGLWKVKTPWNVRLYNIPEAIQRLQTKWRFPKDPRFDIVQWRPREFNVEADALSKEALLSRQQRIEWDIATLCQWTAQVLAGKQTAIWTTFDGAFSKECAGLGINVSIALSESPTLYQELASMAVPIQSDNSYQAEELALSLALLIIESLAVWLQTQRDTSWRRL